RDVQPPPVALEERPPAAAADRPADERAGEVAERPGEREHDVALGPGLHDVAEDDGLRAGDRARGERAGEEHRQLAADREEGVDRHDHEDRVGAVVADPGRQLRGQRPQDEQMARGGVHAVTSLRGRSRWLTVRYATSARITATKIVLVPA